MMRLDNFLVEIGLFDSRTKSKQAIERGEIFIKGKQVVKCALSVEGFSKDDIEFKYQSKFVSLGGYKLEKALNDFKFSVHDLVVADIGSSTGGFTDCLIQKGAKQVFAVDLNSDLLHNSLKNNKKVISIIKNARFLQPEDFSDNLDLIVADLSFISITYLIETFSNLLKEGKNLILLIKPQFETFKKSRFKNGIIRDKKIHEEVCENVKACAENYGFAFVDLTTAPIDKNKNLEFLILLKKE